MEQGPVSKLGHGGGSGCWLEAAVQHPDMIHEELGLLMAL